MRFESGSEGGGAGDPAEAKGEQAAELDKMMRLIEERRRKFEADRAVKRVAGEGDGEALSLCRIMFAARPLVGVAFAESLIRLPCVVRRAHCARHGGPPCRRKRSWAEGAAAEPSLSTTMRSRCF